MQYEKNFYQIRSNESIFEAIKEETKEIGYYDLPLQDIEEIKTYATTITQKYVAVIGIGGSTLGTYAIYRFLKSSHRYNKKLYFFESTDPMDIHEKVQKIDLEDTCFIIISKSGTTVETISIFKYLSNLTTIDKTNSIIVSEFDSKLTLFAQKNGIKTFEIPKNVGGRFSVFSAVGLVPLAIIGVDVQKLLDGAKKVRQSFFSQGKYYEQIMQKGRFLVENKYRFNINILFSYSASLDGFNKWYVQLWGESLGKINVNGTRQGLTPKGLIGPVDQHSFLQLIMEGIRDKTVTFIKIEDFEDGTVIPKDTLKGFDDLSYLDGLKFSSLIDAQANATIEAIKDLKDVPYDVITIDKVDEESIAKLLYSYQLLTSVVGKFVQINTYDQPGVEAGKIILKKKLLSLQ
ncbi:Glucose-6-phosphate isomerase [hydrothermal vent metagenome]|uniref:Glucose-6-phosphate isomerase n=1 Tax=hydrothermal vent metagenome TaxID=652676 RepID=A0A1W1D2K7_9ZZZZ